MSLRYTRCSLTERGNCHHIIRQVVLVADESVASSSIPPFNLSVFEADFQGMIERFWLLVNSQLKQDRV